MIDELGILNNNECTIVNFDRSDKNGSHWIAIWNSDDNSQPDQNTTKVIYLDSLGLSPPTAILTFLRTSGKKILFNNNQLQKSLSVSCGYFACHCLIQLNKKIPIYDIIYEFTQDPSNFNENIVTEIAM